MRMSLPTMLKTVQIRSLTVAAVLVSWSSLRVVLAQHAPPADQLQLLQQETDHLGGLVESLRQDERFQNRDGAALVADVAVFHKAASWMLKYQEFPKADYEKQLRRTLQAGLSRAEHLSSTGTGGWVTKAGRTIRGYLSAVDGSVQPYALTLPGDFESASSKRYPLHLVLHGRANEMNEVNFIDRHEGKGAGAEQTWIQLDVYGRGSNAYRWAGEADVFEALQDVRRRFRIDEQRITLHGFSMGGAGAWHLGMHYPHLWSSVGPGAGFVDFYAYQKQTEQLPVWQHQTLGIYDAVDYALNAFNVPVCTYGGELDPQLAASTTMQQAAAADDVAIQVIIGPGMGHKFDPESQKQFMAFHLDHAKSGKLLPYQRRHIRFETRTLRYNQCDWLRIDEVNDVYEPSRVDAEITADGQVDVVTFNVNALRLAREAGDTAILDGTELPCRSAADGLLPDVWYVRSTDGWDVLSYDESLAFLENPQRRKRHGLQGPIDDAFLSSFVCVEGTQPAWSEAQHAWARWTLSRFTREFDSWMRGVVPVVKDDQVTEDMIAQSNLVLFGDPGSNLMIARILDQLPVTWT
ncbi:MAG: prolyl oligopeptidase family serine peptidase, partial [Planctomycetaceae bacterium]|nr:prolyl oligopeptidase family serine peptidase [Planctomycetaceae bacterium]